MALTKAVIINAGKKEFEPITVMFNPPSLKINSSNSYADPKTPGRTQGNGDTQQQQFIKRDSDVLTVELFFDTTHDGTDVYSVVEPILELARIPKGKTEPPKLVFAWGDFNFPCILVSTEQTYDYFDSEGHALRATIVVTFVRCDPESTEKKQSTVKSVVKKVIPPVTVKAGETLSDISACVCFDPEKWRLVAIANGIDNPLTFNNGEMVGQLLSLP